MSRDRFVSIIDDGPDIAMLYSNALATINGMTLFSFTDPMLALEHFQINKDAYVLVISDLRMPDLNGMELLKRIKELNKYVRTILMTGFDVNDRMFHDYMKEKIIDGFVQKPVTMYDLVKEVVTQIHIYEMQKTQAI